MLGYHSKCSSMVIVVVMLCLGWRLGRFDAVGDASVVLDQFRHGILHLGVVR
jgi:hypothetical protein